MVIQRMTDFELLLLVLSLTLFVSSIVFMFRWIGGSTNDFIGLFSIGGLVVSLAVPFVVVPDALNHAIKSLLSPFTKVAKDLSTDILSDAESTVGRITTNTTAHARQTARELRQEAKEGSWFMRQLLGGTRSKKTKKRA
jgi:hypothetical protein